MDTDPMVMKISKPEDVLALLPYQIGFRPTDSFAVLSVLTEHGRERIGMAARIDIAALLEPAGREEVLTGLLAQLSVDPTAWVFTALYCDEDFALVREGHGAGAILTDWFERSPYADRGATFLVGPERFACLECGHIPACPPHGLPNERISTSPVTAQMVLNGEVVAESREELACPRSAAPERMAVAAAAADRERELLARPGTHGREQWRGRVLDDFGALIEQADGGRARHAPAPDVLGRLGAALTEPHLRDAVVAWVLGGQRLEPCSPGVTDAFEEALTGGMHTPEHEHAIAAARVLTQIVQHAPPGGGAHALAVLGWLAWWRGEGARAGVVVEQCLVEDPCCRLGQLLADMLDGGVRPGWARPAPVGAHPSVG